MCFGISLCLTHPSYLISLHCPFSDDLKELHSWSCLSSLPGVPVGGAVLETGQAHAHRQQAQKDQPQVDQDHARLLYRE